MEEGGSSSAQSSSEEPISSAPTILLHIISPSPEVRTKLTFPHLPISTTVAELKRKICDAVATRPSPDRQRLIYRGRALVQEQATLKEIFSQETVRHCVSATAPQADYVNRSTSPKRIHYILSFLPPGLHSYQDPLKPPQRRVLLRTKTFHVQSWGRRIYGPIIKVLLM